MRLACHPHDPGVPPKGFRGVARVLGTVDGMKRFVDIKESPYHGLNLCLGTTAEMLQQPATEIHDVIRYFGERKKIFNIHFRNIRGTRDDFQEVFPDEGDMNMVEVMRTLKEVDYPYMVMPDHMPHHADDPGRPGIRVRVWLHQGADSGGVSDNRRLQIDEYGQEQDSHRRLPRPDARLRLRGDTTISGGHRHPPRQD